VKACESGILNSCINVSVMYRNGDGVPVDHKKAGEYVGLAKEIVRQMEESSRLTFQEGVESAE
jgi:TPR repeat protein